MIDICKERAERHGGSPAVGAIRMRHWRGKRVVASFVRAAGLAVGLSGLTLGLPGGAAEWLDLKDGAPVAIPAENGDRVPDFSAAGYGVAGASIPPVADVLKLTPRPHGGDGEAIQAALDSLATRPLDAKGFRGAVVLSAGSYRLNDTLSISASGILLRGAGAFAGGTRLLFEGSTGPVIKIHGSGRWRALEAPRRITSSYVPVGAMFVKLDNVDGLAAGDRVIVQRPFTASWLSKVGMDRIPPKAAGAVRQWKPGPGVLLVRTVVSIDADLVALDAPIMDGIRSSDSGVLWRYEFPGEIQDVGIEGILIDATASAPKAKISYEMSRRLKSSGIVVDQARNVWISGVGFRNVANSVDIGTYATDVTVENVAATNDIEPWWRVPPSAFSVDGQRVLVRNCSFVGKFTTLVTTQSLAGGPIVFQDCVGVGTGIDAGPHQRWAVGTLYDNIVVPNTIAVRNRGNMGTGHGWAAANTVIWNSVAVKGFLVEEPPGAHTWVFGGKGPILRTSNVSASIVSPQTTMVPRSLFAAQLDSLSAKRSIERKSSTKGEESGAARED